jgi:outer membrane protein
MKKQVLAAAVVCSLMSGAVFAQQSKEGPWMVRARAVSLQSANTDDTGLGLSINDKWIPEVDISYFFNKNFAMELILTVPQKQELSSSKLANKSVPRPSSSDSLAQYHFDTNGIKPWRRRWDQLHHFLQCGRSGRAASIDKSS